MERGGLNLWMEAGTKGSLNQETSTAVECTNEQMEGVTQGSGFGTKWMVRAT